MKLRLSRRAFAAGAAGLPLVPRAVGNEPAKAEFSPRVFDRHSFRTMAALAEIFIPRTDTGGAGDALVTEHLDALLEASPQAERQQFLDGLWAYDAFCRHLQRDGQVELVKRALEDAAHPQHAFVSRAKALTARIYYSTETGQRELNKGGRVPPAYA